MSTNLVRDRRGVLWERGREQPHLWWHVPEPFDLWASRIPPKVRTQTRLERNYGPLRPERTE